MAATAHISNMLDKCGTPLQAHICFEFRFKSGLIFLMGIFFSSVTGRTKVSEFTLNVFILGVDLSLLFGFVGKAEEKLGLAVQAHGDA